MIDENKVKNLFDKEKRKFVKRVREHAKGFQPNSYRKKAKRTSAEQGVMNVLDELQISYEIEFPIQFGNHCKLYDIKIVDKNILIEVDGDFWHGNLDQNVKLNFLQLKNKKNDALKNVIAKIRGYKLIRIWEFEINNFRDDVISKLKKEICRESVDGTI